MDLKEIFTWGGAGLLLILSFIKIPKIEINLWGWLAKIIGKALNGEVLNKIDEVDKKVNSLEDTLNQHLYEEEVDKIKQCRERILRFAAEICRKQKHTQEQFNEILDDVDNYEIYCKDHPEYANTKAVASIDIIKNTYKKCLETQDFLRE